MQYYFGEKIAPVDWVRLFPINPYTFSRCFQVKFVVESDTRAEWPSAFSPSTNNRLIEIIVETFVHKVIFYWRQDIITFLKHFPWVSQILRTILWHKEGTRCWATVRVDATFKELTKYIVLGKSHAVVKRHDDDFWCRWFW